jgi:hypothetical protein
MADNPLSIKISVDTSEVRAKLALAQVDMRNYAAEVRRLATEFKSAGADARSGLEAALQSAAGQLGRATEAAAAMRAELSRQLKPALSETAGQLGELKGSLAEVAATFGVGFSVEAIVEGLKSLAELGEQTVNTAAAVGLTTEAYSTLSQSLKLLGGDTDAAARSLTILQTKMVEAIDNPESKAASAFESLLGKDWKKDVSAGLKDLEGFQVRLAKVAASFAPSPSRTADFRELYGRSMQNFIPYLMGGEEGIKEFNELARKTGSIIGDELGEKLDKTALKLHELDEAFTGLKLEVINHDFRAINDSLQTMINLLETLSGSNPKPFALLEAAQHMQAALGMGLPAVKAPAPLPGGTSPFWDRFLTGADPGSNEPGSSAYTPPSPEPLPPSADTGEGREHEGTAHSPAPNPKPLAPTPRNVPAEKKALDDQLRDLDKEQKAREAQLDLEIVEARGNQSAIDALERQKLAVAQDILARKVAANRAANADIRKDETEFTVSSINLQKQALEQSQKAQDADLARADASAARQANTLNRQLSAYKSELDAEVSLGNITKAQAVALEAEKYQQIYQIELATLQHIASDLAQTPAQHQAANEKIEELEAGHAAKMAEFQKEITAAVEKETEKQEAFYKSIFDKIESSIDSSIAGVLSGSEKFADALKKIRESLISSFTEGVTKALSSAAASALAGPLGVKFKEDETPSISGLLSKVFSNALGSMFGLGKDNAAKDAPLLKNTTATDDNTKATEALTKALGGKAQGKDGNLPSPVTAGSTSASNVPVSVTGVASDAATQTAGTTTGPTVPVVPVTSEPLPAVQSTSPAGLDQASQAVDFSLEATGEKLKNYCATLVNQSLEKAGVPGSGSNLASSFKTYGQPVAPDQVQKGDVFYTGPSGRGDTGHVGFALGPVQQGQVPVMSSHLQGDESNPAGSEWRNAQNLIFRRPPYATDTAVPTAAASAASDTSNAEAAERTADASEALGASLRDIAAAAGAASANFASLNSKAEATTTGISTTGDDSQTAAPKITDLGDAAKSAADKLKAAATPQTGADTGASSPTPTASPAPAAPAQTAAMADSTTGAGGFGGTVAGIGSIIGPLLSIAGLASKGNSPIKTVLSGVGTAFSAISEITKLFSGGGGGILDKVKGLFGAGSTGAAGGAGDASQAASNSAAQALSKVSQSATQAGASLSQTGSSAATAGAALTTTGTAGTAASTGLTTAGAGATVAGTGLTATGVAAPIAATGLTAAGTSAVTAGTEFAIAGTEAAAGGAAGAAGKAAGGLSSLFLGLFAEGTPQVPHDGFAFIHKDEAVIPAKGAGLLRSGVASMVSQDALKSLSAGVNGFGLRGLKDLPQLDVGAWELKDDMYAQVHKGEMVIPESYASGMRSNSGPRSEGSGASGGDAYHMHFHTPDARAAHRFIMDNKESIVRAFGSARRGNMPGTR